MEDLLFSAVRLAVPILFLAIGGMVAEKAGVLNLGVEGLLLCTALAAAFGAEASGAVGGIVLSLAVGLVYMAVVAVATVIVRADQIVTGLALNVAAIGVTGFVFRSSFGSGQNFERIGVLHLPFLDSVPFLRIPFRQSLLVYALVVLSVLVAWVLYRTRAGLCVRAVGDAPAAVDSQGVSVTRVRVQALLFAGFMGGLAGSYLVLVETGRFVENMSGGRGFLAIAAIVLGGWRLFGVVGACLLFGLGQALQFQLPAMGIDAPNQLWLALPYVLALAAITALPQRASAPAALLRPFVRGER
jgi:simple sugar transport system permease protein